MCSAKTTGALQAARRYGRHGSRVILVRPTRSRRAHEGEDGFLRTKDGTAFRAVDVSSANQIAEHCRGHDVVWIDEPTIFQDEADLAGVVADLRMDSIILISGLGATSELEPFGTSMPKLLAVADEVTWQTADCDICRSFGTATRSLFIGSKKAGQVHVGGAENYRPACPACWTKIMTADGEARETLLSVLRQTPRGEAHTT